MQFLKLVLILLTLFIFSTFFYNSQYKKIPICYWDEYYFIGQSYFFELYLKKDFENALWQGFFSYEQPKLVEYFYGLYLYPYYLKTKKNNQYKNYIDFLIDHNFYYAEGIENEKLKIKRNFIDWGKNPAEVTNVSAYFLINKFGDKLKKTINLIYQVRQANVYLLSFAVVIFYLISFSLSNSHLISLLSSFLYGLNIFIVESSLKAHSEGLFLLLFNSSLLLLALFFKKNFDFKLGMLFFIVSGLLTATKLNGVMMVMVFNLFLIICLISFLIKKKDFLKILKLIVAGNLVFLLVFVGHHPFLYKDTLKRIIYLYQYRYAHSIYLMNNFNKDALSTYQDRFLALYNNFFSDKHMPKFNNYYPIKPLIEKHPEIASKTLFFIFLSGFLLFFKNLKKNRERVLFLSTFVLIIFFMINYLLLNWDRYFVPIVPFLVFFISFFLGSSLIFVFNIIKTMFKNYACQARNKN